MLKLNGIGVSEGIAFSKVFIYKKENPEIVKKAVKDTEAELTKFKSALDESEEQLDLLYKKACEELGEEDAGIFTAHKMFLEDPEFVLGIRENINSGDNAEFAVKKVADSFIESFSLIDDEYIRERIADIKDVSERLIKNIMGIKEKSLSDIEEECIIAAYDLTPSDTAAMNKEKIKGFITQIGGKTSHTSIIAKTIGIPAVVGVDDIFKRFKGGENIILDGFSGSVFISPDEDTAVKYMEISVNYNNEKNKLKKYTERETVTSDGKKYKVFANIANHHDVSYVTENGAEGIGLFRTEFIFMDRSSLPTEDEQFEIYKSVLESMAEKPVIIRTLDIGGDKEAQALNLSKEANPFMGYRAIRICLDRKDIFKTQLRAILRAGVYGNAEIMFPMISSVEELLKAKDVLNEVKNELKSENAEFSENIKIGIMIEVPSAALISDILAKNCDFFSIGTNDLIQYFTAVDRTNEKVQDLYNPYNPAIIRILNYIIFNGLKAGITVGMCGELASDENFTDMLCGFGLNEFSVNPSSVLKTRRNICLSNSKDNEKKASDVLKAQSSDEVKNILKNGM